jgi:hypothetical protein
MGAQNLLESADDLQERIRERARAIWEREGRPEGRHDEHWRQAENEINAESDAASVERKGRKTSAKKVKSSEEAKVTTAAAEPAPRRRPKKSAPVADAATAQEVAGKGKASKTRTRARLRRRQERLGLHQEAEEPALAGPVAAALSLPGDRSQGAWMPKTSAGLLPYRRRNERLEIAGFP